MDHLPGFAWMKDRKGRYVYVNKPVTKIPAYKKGWRGKTDYEIWPVHVATEFSFNDQKVIQTGQVLQTVECYTVGAEPHYVLVSKFPIRNPKGTVVSVGGISIDIRERTAAIVQLHKLPLRKRQILQMIAEGSNTKEIADLLGISAKTVETHRSQLMAQLNIHNVPGLVRYAIRTRLISGEG